MIKFSCMPAQSTKQTNNSRQRYKFLKAEDIQQRLKDQNEESLIETLTAFRNQLTIKHDEGVISASDERLLLVKSWLDVRPGAQEIFDIWERLNTRQLHPLTLVISVLSTLISLMSSHYTYHSLVAPIVKALLTPQWYSKLNMYLSTSHNELLLVTLKLYYALSSFSGGRERRAIFEVFPWDAKSLPKLLHMRRKKKGDDVIDDLLKPDIRTLYVLLLLSFVDGTTPSPVKSMFLEQKRDLFIVIFKGLYQDSYLLVRKVLEICWIGLWSDPKIKRTLKLGVFNESTVAQILRLYDRTTPEGPTAEDVTADVAHHFLLAICTRPGTGICFKDCGWYSREEADTGTQPDIQTAGPSRTGNRVYNKILANIIKTLKVNEDARQQELAYRILQACPELVAGYWLAASLTLEPRLSSRWIANIAFFGSVISLPVPQTTFLLLDSDLYQPSPPPLVAFTENILPSTNIRAHLSRGLQSTSPLVQHCTAIAFAKCLVKYGAVLQAMHVAETALEEDEEGQWTKRRLELEREIMRRVPEFQVVVAFAQQTSNDAHTVSDDPSGRPVKVALLAECAQRLLWLYHQWLPDLVAEARFDVGRLLQGIQGSNTDTDSGVNGLTKIRQLHVLRLLKESDQFTLSSKTGTSRGNLSILLKLYVSSGVRAMRTALSALLRHTLSTTVLFQHDIDEVDLWLSALSLGDRSTNTEAPDGTPLTSQDDAVIAFLDDCAQRCIKTPYRYLEGLEKAWVLDSRGEVVNNMTDHAEAFPSPLLVTILEQIEAKLRGSLMTPSDALSVFTFIRKLLWNMAQKVQSIQPLVSVAKSIESLLPLVEVFGECMSTAIRREVRLLLTGLDQLVAPSQPISRSINPVVEEFLSRVEDVPLPETLKDREASACELVEWLRLANQTLHVSQFGRLVAIVSRMHAGQSRTLFDYLDPSEDLLWAHLDRVRDSADVWHRLDFALMFMHSHDAILEDERSRDLLAKSLFQATGAISTNLRRSLNLINLRLVSSGKQETRCYNLLLLLHSIASKMKESCADDSSPAFLCILQLTGVQQAARNILPAASRNALSALLEVIDSAGGAECKHAISALANSWVTELENELDSLSSDQIATASMWVRFAEVPGLSTLLEHYCNAKRLASSHAPTILERLISSLNRRIQYSQSSLLAQRIPQLLFLRTVLTESPALEQLIDLTLSGVLPPFTDGRFGHVRATYSVAEALKDLQPSSVKVLELLEVDIRLFLGQHTWTEHTASIVAQLTYARASARYAVMEWLRTCKLENFRVSDLALVIHALLDRICPAAWFEDDTTYLSNVFAIFTQKLAQDSLALRDASSCINCIALLPNLPSPVSQQIVLSMYDKLRTQGHHFNPHLLSIARCLSMHPAFLACPLLDHLINSGLEWISASLSNNEEGTSATDDMLVTLSFILKAIPEVKTHLSEALLTTIIQYHLDKREAVLLACELVMRTKLKPATINRYIQAIVQHPKLYALCSSILGTKEEIVSLLGHLFNIHPTNSCQFSHVEPLLHLYGGTLSSSDRKVLSIFVLFEQTRKTSVAELFTHWSPSADISCDGALEVLQNLEPACTWRTCLHFSQWARSATENVYNHGDLYDPTFIALIFSCMIGEDTPTTATDWVQLFRTNVVSLLIRALSSHQEDLRQLALVQIAAVHQKLQDADMQERSHVLYILDLLKDLYPRISTDRYPQRLSAYTTLHLAYALRGLFHPSHFTYPITARFLLQRPELDPSDVPSLYTMLYSTSDQWRRERTWMVRFLTDGMVGRLEWKVLRRRHTWDLVASMFSVEERDQGLRRSVLELLANITCNKYATTSLLLGSALLSWVELQTQSMHAGEGLAWVKILENIIVVVDSPKVEATTGGEWRSTIGRCLSAVLNHQTCTHSMIVHIMQVLSRLCHLPVSSVTHGNKLVKDSIKHLKEMETTLRLDKLPKPRRLHEELASNPPHTARHLWDTKDMDSWRVWGMCVETLWTVAMASEVRYPEWYALIQRVLLWRAIAGDESSLAEWVRKEVVNNIGE